MACEIDKAIAQFNDILAKPKTTDVQRKLINASLSKLEALAEIRDGESIAVVVAELAKVGTSRVVDDVKPWDVKGTVVWGQRVSDKQAQFIKGYTAINNFGNPFTTGEFASATAIDSMTASGDNNQASVQYYNWLMTNTIPSNYDGDVKLLNARRDWIVSNLGKIRNATVIAYKGTARGKKVSHINALIKASEELDTGVAPSISTKVNVDSNQQGLEYALTNPTHTSPRGFAWTKGDKPTRDMLSKGIDYNGKHYSDVEQAFQSLKDKNESKTRPTKKNSSNYKLMVDLITAKLQAFPRLVSGINNKGGLDYLNTIVHQPTNANSVWETGGQDWFKSALIDAYNNVSGIQDVDANVEFDKKLNTKLKATNKQTYEEVIATPAEIATIKAANDKFKAQHASKFQVGDEFHYDPRTGMIIVMEPTEDMDSDMVEVYTAHEIRHALTYDWISKNENAPKVKYLKAAIAQFQKDYNPETTLESNLLKQRMDYASDVRLADDVQVAELVAILSSEPNIRKEFMKAFPQERKSALNKILDILKKWLGGHAIDMGQVIAAVDSIVDKGTIAYNTQTSEEYFNRGLSAEAIQAIKDACK